MDPNLPLHVGPTASVMTFVLGGAAILALIIGIVCFLIVNRTGHSNHSLLAIGPTPFMVGAIGGILAAFALAMSTLGSFDSSVSPGQMRAWAIERHDLDLTGAEAETLMVPAMIPGGIPLLGERDTSDLVVLESGASIRSSYDPERDLLILTDSTGTELPVTAGR
ncbi:hypothetical protein Bequi_09970 [Brachybacterium sp. JHP9]|uniref:Uncharacterized protein n=1 Tax=Brachybacterium equifaecis TaxID=2910770 RepID=A0ABT0R1R0_9MICO|nr:hypothetical protein [Brachybacterium equifaecis]MCL6423710.1 hypothetical protein [Brachybacterium equifaecis]